MPFKRASELEHTDPMLIWLKGLANTGKSILAAEFIRTHSPGMAIPMDMRAETYQQLDREPGTVCYIIDEGPDHPRNSNWQDENEILRQLAEGLPGSDVQSLVWDSPTPGFRRETDRGNAIASYIDGAGNMNKQKLKQELIEKFGHNNVNKTSAYQGKAAFMAAVASLAQYGLPTIWVNHEFEGIDRFGKEGLKPLISKQETEKMMRNLNVRMRTYVNDRGQYCVEIEWARDRPQLTGKVYTDQPNNMWRGIWKVIEADFFAAETVDFWDRETYIDDKEAIALAMEIVVEKSTHPKKAIFGALNHAQNTFKNVKKALFEEIEESVVMKDLRKKNPDAWKLKAREKLAEAWRTELRTRIDAIENPEPKEEETDVVAEGLAEMHEEDEQTL